MAVTKNNLNIEAKEWFIQAPWGRICIMAWGNCFDPPVLMLHGHLDSAVSFQPLVELLPQKFYYVAMELPGNGKSDPFPRGLMISMFDLVYPIEVVRRHFRWNEFVFIAHSAGGIVGRLYQLTYPQRMSKVVEIDTVWGPHIFEAEDFVTWYHKYFTDYYKRYKEFNELKENRLTIPLQEAIDKLCKNRNIPPVKARATLERWSEPVDDRKQIIRYTFDQRLKQVTPPPISSDQLKKLYSKMVTPTLAVISNGSVQKGLYKKVPFLLKEDELKNYRIVKVDGHHDVFITNPERMSSFISQFLINGLDGVEYRAKL